MTASRMAIPLCPWLFRRWLPTIVRRKQNVVLERVVPSEARLATADERSPGGVLQDIGRALRADVLRADDAHGGQHERDDDAAGRLVAIAPRTGWGPREDERDRGTDDQPSDVAAPVDPVEGEGEQQVDRDEPDDRAGLETAAPRDHVVRAEQPEDR